MKTVCSKQIALERGRRITNNRNMLWAHTLFRRPRSSPNLTLPEADKRIAMLTAKLKLLDGDISESVRPRHQLLISGFSCRITFSNERWTSMRPL
jgi:hypothetical protein